MRAELFYNPLALFQRVGEWAETRRRLCRLRGTVAGRLHDGHIDSLELLELLRPAGLKVIFDIGANIGTWTLLAKAIYPHAEIHAFEPLPQHFAGFQKSAAGITGVRLHEVALGAEGACVTMHVNSFSDTSSVLDLTALGRDEWDQSTIDEVPLTLRGLDEFVAEHHIKLPDLVKLDVQGFELEVLKGAERTLAHAKAVIAEVSFKEYYRGQCRFDELVTFLAARGLYVRAFGVRTARGKSLSQTDVLFARFA